MRLHFILLVTLTALFAGSNALSSTAGTNQASRLGHSVNAGREGNGRSLRLARTSEDAEGEDSTDGEERGGGVSTLISKISDKIPLSVKTVWWLERGKSDEVVLEKLGLKGLEGAALTGHKNYPHFLKYADRHEESDILELTRREYPTYSMWKDLKLNEVTTLRNGMTRDEILTQLKGVQHTEGFRFYKRYAIAFDDHMISLFGSGYNRPTQFIDKEATPIEKLARAEIWAEKGIHKDYVKEFLGLLRATPEQLRKNPYYDYYSKLADQLKKNKASR